MRLTCPNCGAQYEVPDEVIPESGRDVQCSNCGQTWFQHHRDHQPEDIDEASEYVEDDWEDTDDPEQHEEEQTSETDDALEDEPEQAVTRELDPEVANVLREEASREESARAAESGGLETQPDLGLREDHGSVDERTRQANERMARLRGLTEEEPVEPDHDIDPSSRRNLLPDIDEASTTIGADKPEISRGSEADEAMEPSSAPKPGGFRRGFRIAVLIAILATVLYVLAPKISAMVPALQPALTSYVDAVNTGRVALNEAVGPLIGQIGSLLGGE